MHRLLPALLVLLIGALPSVADEPVVRLVEFDGPITAATKNRFIQAFEDAERERNDFVLVVLDTPGGSVAALEDVVKAMLGSSVPIVVWVGPYGSQAASAGFFLVISADLATMAPGTRTGAASAIYGVPGQASEEGDVLLKKANEDLAALLRSIAERRDRNVEACERAVMAAEAWSEAEALEEGLIDLVAENREELLAELEGTEVKRFDGSTVVLRTEGVRFVTSEFSFRQEIWEFLATPAVAFFLLLVGAAGIWVELSHPGLIFPAVVGAICLILFAFSAQVLPVSTIGVLLILLGMVLFILEIKVVSYGMLTVGGATCLVLGSLMLFKGPIPEMRVPVLLVLPSALGLTLLCAFIVWLVVRAHKVKVATGVEGIVGEIGTVRDALDPEGKIFVHGELWDATSSAGAIPAGTRVRVLKAEELLLIVEPETTRRTEGG
jgi:membrane-bound serine protease (ClpP class)